MSTMADDTVFDKRVSAQPCSDGLRLYVRRMNMNKARNLHYGKTKANVRYR